MFNDQLTMFNFQFSILNIYHLKFTIEHLQWISIIEPLRNITASTLISLSAGIKTELY